MAEQLNIIIVPHTHWDREWYQTFQQFRIRLVRTINKLLNILDRDPDFKYFMLDGQTIVLDDYLEVHPEQEDHLRQYIRSGRILVGPWYLQPDEFLVSGESLIRNLQIGLQRASEFGEPMRVGYVPDCFGHIAQLPQILQGFDIQTAVFWRGVGAEAHKSEFHWAAPDGTQVLVIHLSDPIGYSNARVLPLTQKDFVTRIEILAAQILQKATTNNLLFMNGSDHLEPQDGLPAVIATANGLMTHLNPEHEKIIAHFTQSNPSTNGRHYDTIHVQMGTLPQYIEAVREQMGELQTLSGEMRSSQFAHLLPSVLSSRIWIKQQNNAAEHLLEHWVEPLTAWAWKLGAPYPGALVRLAWKYLLQNHPHDSICGCSIDQVHRENRVRFAQSQQIGESVLAQALQQLIESIASQAPIKTSHTNYEPVPIVVFNPAPGPRTAATQVVVQLPGSLRNAVLIQQKPNTPNTKVTNRWKQERGVLGVFGGVVAAAVTLAEANAPGQLIQMAHEMAATALGENPDSFVITRIHIEAGQQPGIENIEAMIAPKHHVTVNQQELLAAEEQIHRLLAREDIHSLEVSVVDQSRETLEFLAADLPAFGLKTFWLYPRGLNEGEHSTPVSSLVVQQQEIENEWYKVEASTTDGTITITDKQSGAVFGGLNRFVDGGDTGDLYNYCPPSQDLLVSSPIEPPKIVLGVFGFGWATLRISGKWALPAHCTADRNERSEQTLICPIVSEVSLTPGVKRIDIHTSIDNLARDHRLRVTFPVSYIVEYATAEGTFEVRTRPVALPRPADGEEWVEEPVNTFPQKRFVDISNGEIGLGVLNRGLPEYEVLQNGPGIAEGQMGIALTLLRSVEWLSRGDLATRRGHAGPMEHTPEAQCLGLNEFDYALVPHSGDWEAEEALVLREAQAFNIGVQAMVGIQTSATEAIASTRSLLEIEPRELVVSAIKQSLNGDGLIVRVYNPLSRAVEALIRPGVACTRAFVANLQEEKQEQFFWSGEDGEPLSVGIRAGGIVTILFQ